MAISLEDESSDSNGFADRLALTAVDQSSTGGWQKGAGICTDNQYPEAFPIAVT
jgi:hypothetical protein